MIDLKTLLNSQIDVSDTNNLDKVFVFNNINSISEALIQRLMYRLENINTTNPAKIIILVNKNSDEKMITDTMYGNFEDSGTESKAMDVALRYAGNFKTPIYIHYTDSNSEIYLPNSSAIIHIDTLGSKKDMLSGKLAKHSKDVDFRPSSHAEKHLYLDGFIDTENMYLNLLYSHPETPNNPTVLTGETIPANIVDNAIDYMVNDLPNEVQESLLLASSMFNVINSFLTENMKLEYSRLVINKKTLETNTSYFSRKLSLFSYYGLDINVLNLSVKGLGIIEQLEEKLNKEQKEMMEQTNVDDINFAYVDKAFIMVRTTERYYRDLQSVYELLGDVEMAEIILDVSKIIREFIVFLDSRKYSIDKRDYCFSKVMFNNYLSILGGTFKWLED